MKAILQGQKQTIDEKALIPRGGQSGQVLAKNSDLSYDVEWKDLDISNIEEQLQNVVTVDNGAYMTLEGEFNTEGHIIRVTEEGDASQDETKIVVSFNGRSGKVVAQKGDYTAEMVGAIPLDEIDTLVPPGGTTGQVLAKKSSKDRDTEWKDVGSSIPVPVSIENGGTGATNITEARKNLEAAAENHNHHGNYTYTVCIGPEASVGNWGGTAVGYGANTASYDSTAMGHDASSKGYSVAIGANSKTCRYGVSIGQSARISQDIDGAIAIGNAADVNSTYSIGIGQSVSIPENSEKTIQLGNDLYISSLKCKVGLTVTSDQRDKTDINEIQNGALEFLKKIKPVRYVWNGRNLYIYDDELLTEKDKKNKRKYGLCSYDKEAHERGDKKGQRVRVGVLAQEVQKAMEETFGDKSYGNIVNDNFFDLDPSTIPEDVENQLSVTYENFIPFIIKAIQELDININKITNQIETFEWEDGNFNKEDRAGRFVTLKGNKIKLANPEDNFILGLVSESSFSIKNKVSMTGKLVAVDDGTCEVDGWCTTWKNGIATKSVEQTKYRVMERLDESHIRILIV